MDVPFILTNIEQYMRICESYIDKVVHLFYYFTNDSINGHGEISKMLTKTSTMNLGPEFSPRNRSNRSCHIPVVLHGEIEDILYTTSHWRIHIDAIGTDNAFGEARHLHGTIPLAN